MKAVICLCAFVVVTIARPEDTHYTDKYDHLDIQETLRNTRLLHSHIKCGLDLGKCTPEGMELKSKVGEALETGCAKCTEKQKNSIRIVIKHLINHEPEYWKQLCAKYDPEGKYTKKYEEDLKAAA